MLADTTFFSLFIMKLTEQQSLEGSTRDEHIKKMTSELKVCSDTLLHFQQENHLLDEEKRKAEDSNSRFVSEAMALQNKLQDKNSELVRRVYICVSWREGRRTRCHMVCRDR